MKFGKRRRRKGSLGLRHEAKRATADLAPLSEAVLLAARILQASTVPPVDYAAALATLTRTFEDLRAGGAPADSDGGRKIQSAARGEGAEAGRPEGRAGGVSAKPRRRKRARRSLADGKLASETGRAEAGEQAATPEPQQVRLIRRAELMHDAAPTIGTDFHKGPRRSVVKWFDEKHRRGALNVPGIGGDVAISGAMLDAFGLHRLFRGQEVLVEVTERKGATDIVSLALPGETAAADRSFGALPPDGRRGRPVVVEDKRKALQRVGAKLKAENLFAKTTAENGSDD